MRRLVALVLLSLAAAAPARAVVVRGRPISTLRLHGQLSPLKQPSIATDGKRFLLAFDTFSDAYHRNYVFTQLVNEDGVAQPPLLLGRGSDPAVVWTGQQYVVVWSGFQKDGVGTSGGQLRRAVITRGGALRDAAAITDTPYSGARMAWNGKRILLVASAGFQQVTRMLLDRSGRLTTEPTSFAEARNSTYWTVAAAYGRYFVGFSGGDESIVSVREDGEVIGRQPLPAGTDAAEGAFAFDGSSLLFFFASVRRVALYVAPVDRDGTPGSPSVILRDTALESRPQVPYAAFDGSRFVVAYTIEDAFSGRDAAIVGIDGTGRVVAPVARVAVRGGNQTATGLACAGRHCAVVIGDRDRGDEGGTLYLIDRSTTLTLGGPLLDPQSLPTIAASANGYMIAWWEDEATQRRLYASRVAADGSFLDGVGIALASLPMAIEPQRPAIASDGDGWLVVWSDSRVHGVRISSAGAKLDAVPIEILNGNNPAVAWNGSRYLVVSEEQAAIPMAFVGRDGRVSARAPFIPPDAAPGTLPHRPALTWDGVYFMLAYVLSSTPLDGSQLAARIDDDGVPVDAQPIAIGSGPLPLGAASDGVRYCFTSNGISTAPVGDPRRISRTDFYGYQAYSDGRVARRAREFTTVFAHSGDEVLIFPTDGSAQRLVEFSGFDEIRSPDVACIGDACAVVYAHINPADATQRIELVFAHEVSVDALGTLPEPPQGVAVSGTEGDRMVVSWQPVTANGYEIETSQDGVAYRRVEVAPANATSASVPLAPFVRVRAVNVAGSSAPSAPAGL